MGSIILTGISHGKHQFSLTYPEVEGVEQEIEFTEKIISIKDLG